MQHAFFFPAKQVFMGRPLIWGLACGGEEGAEAVLNTLKAELDSVMALSGKTPRQG